MTHYCYLAGTCTWEVEGRGSEAQSHFSIYNKLQTSLGYMRSPLKNKSKLINIGNANNNFHSILQGWAPLILPLPSQKSFFPFKDN